MSASKKKTELKRRLRLFASELGRIDWTGEVSRSFGDIKTKLEKQGRLIEDMDIAIAAHALANEHTLITSNSKHMNRVPGLKLTTREALGA